MVEEEERERKKKVDERRSAKNTKPCHIRRSLLSCVQNLRIGTKQTIIAFHIIKGDFTSLQLIVFTENTGETGLSILGWSSGSEFDAFRVGHVRFRSRKWFLGDNYGSSGITGIIDRGL